MGYAYYILVDGREAGYGVEAKCDKDVCDADIDRGLGFLCGRSPNGFRDFAEWGCGNYFCMNHLHAAGHDCPQPQCFADWRKDGVYDMCELAAEPGTDYCEEHQGWGE